jgi:hypothetical protein
MTPSPPATSACLPVQSSQWNPIRGSKPATAKKSSSGPRQSGCAPSIQVSAARGQQRGVGAGERPQPKAAALEVGQRLELGLGHRQPGQDGLGVPQRHLAGVGEADATGSPLDQLHAALAFQGGDLPGDGRLGQEQRLGRSRE